MGRLVEWSRGEKSEWCSLERALDVLANRSTFLVLREAFYGARRFDAFTRGTGLTEASVAKRVRELVAAGLLTRQDYQEPGERTRQEYVLTESGRALFPAFVALQRWGDEFREDRPAVVELVHAGCGAPVDAVVRCTHAHDVTIDQVEARLRTP
ncbi:winged helix-turn-helix transcriptional regulator [Actinoplanes solisilvae]|uniref:winged helix-turn-helix transcriptional regulator n=1 Tax=Actinoplanes solisilvae TaxID=2486853 RepID=UPI001F0CB0D7|nr:helix-turn-helix domain-containing protein [Actinoplanes solisilvae]